MLILLVLVQVYMVLYILFANWDIYKHMVGLLLLLLHVVNVQYRYDIKYNAHKKQY